MRETARAFRGAADHLPLQVGRDHRAAGRARGGRGEQQHHWRTVARVAPADVLQAPTGACSLTVEEIQKRIWEREQVRRARNWQLSDRIRDMLRADGCAARCPLAPPRCGT